MSETKVKAYLCGIKGTGYQRVVHSTRASKARYQYLLDVSDAGDYSFADISVRSLGEPRTDAGFEKTATYRGVPYAKIGMSVLVDGDPGVIVGNNSSANFDVLMKGVVRNCHPNWRMKYFDSKGAEIIST